MADYDSFIEKLNSGSRFIIASHYNPDGDGIGSTIAMAMVLEGMGKDVVLYNRDAVPANLHFLPMIDRFVNTIGDGDSFDAAIMVDCAQKKRISDEFAELNNLSFVACIDHHVLDDAEADFLLVDKNAASTGEVVLRLLNHVGFKVNEAIAQCIYTTLVVDSGFFKYSNTTSHVLAIASELVEAGASPWIVAKNLDESFSASRLQLLSLALASLAVEVDGRYATMEVTQEMLNKSKATIDMSDEFATYPRSIKGVEAAALFRVVEKDLTKVSLRSKDYVDVSAIAKSFGGGGHARAAGFRMCCSIGEAKAKVLKAVKEAL